jgi:type IV secretion system protein VirD4
LGRFDTPELNEMTATDDLCISSIGKQKTALFVVVSDTDRSLDGLVNVFFTQAMNELCRVADRECEDNCLPVPVRFILDDFATNCKIEEFPRMIASIRSRGISTMLMIQAESQLTESFGGDGKTIIGNCDTYVYLGGNDVDTAKAVAERCDVPVKKVLNMPVQTNWIFRRGQAPINARNFNLDELLKEKKLLEEQTLQR